MTMQAAERLAYRGRCYSLRGSPLFGCTDPWLQRRLEQRQMSSTALHRGFQGTWAIRGSRLWLDDIRLTVRDYVAPGEWVHSTRGLGWLFPGVDGPVPADWFTGVLESPRGKAQRSSLFSLVWPYARLFHVVAGRVVATELRDDRRAYRAGIKKMTRLEAVLSEL